MVLSDSAMKAIDAMDDFVDIKLQDPSAVDEGIFCEVVAKKIMAQEAVITEIGTKEITLKTGGKIQSEVYIPGVTGFMFSADGTLNAINAALVSGVFTGNLDSPPLTTTNEGTLGSAITFNAFSHWKVNDVYNALSASLTPAIWNTITGSYNGTSLVKALITSTAINVVEYDTGAVNSESNNLIYTFTTQYAGNYKFDGVLRDLYDVQAGDLYPEQFSLYIDGSLIIDGWRGIPSYTYAIAAGKEIKAIFHGDYGEGFGTTLETYSLRFKVLSIISAGVSVRTSNTLYNFPPSYYYSSVNRLIINSPSIDTASSTYKKYAKATAFLSGVSSYTLNMFKTAQGTVSIDGANKTINGVMKTSTGMTVFHNTGSVALIAATSDPGSSGYYNISGSYQVQATIEGADTKNLNAKAVDTYSIGTIKRYLNITAKTMIAETFDDSSSREKKKDITPFLDSALEILGQVQVVNYRYKSETDEYLHTGFIAEDTPQALTGAGHKSMSLGDNIGMLIKAVQELYELVKGD